MAHVAGRLSVAASEERREACEDAMSSRRFQTIWLSAKGHSTGEAAATASFGQRWIAWLFERRNSPGPSALGDLRRGAESSARILRPEPLEHLRLCARAAARRRNMDERQGSALNGGGTGAGLARAVAQEGGVAGNRLVDPVAAAARPEGGDGRGARGLQKLAEVVARATRR